MHRNGQMANTKNTTKRTKQTRQKNKKAKTQLLLAKILTAWKIYQKRQKGSKNKKGQEITQTLQTEKHESATTQGRRQIQKYRDAESKRINLLRQKYIALGQVGKIQTLWINRENRKRSATTTKTCG